MKGTIAERGDEWLGGHAPDHPRRLGRLIHARRPHGAARAPENMCQPMQLRQPTALAVLPCHAAQDQ